MSSSGTNRVKTAGVALLVVSLLAAGVLLLRAQLRPENEPVAPNILLISLCSVRPDHMSCYGYQRETTPNFEILARDAIVFDNAITQWPKTVPGFTTIMTAKYGHTTGVMRVTPRQHLGDEHETLAEILRAHGYDTGVFMTSPVVNQGTNLLQGFDTIEETWRLPWQRVYAAATKRAIAWLKQRRQAPFFAWVHYNSAHQPYYPFDAPPDLFVGDDFYDPTKRVQLNEAPLRPEVSLVDQPYAKQITRPDIGGVHPTAVLPANPNELAYYVAQYDACIRSADRRAGDVLRVVQKMGLLENTIVAVVGDHGEALGEHNYYFGHGRLPYNDCARVPLLIRPAGGSPPIRVEAPVAAFGLAPTLLELAGIEAPEQMEARSLLPVAHGVEPGRYVFMESGYAMKYSLSVWNGPWKLVHLASEIDRLWAKGAEYELYNLRDDPGELTNLYDAMPALVGQLQEVLKEWSAPWVDEAYRTVGTGTGELDDETRERLRALGYIP